MARTILLIWSFIAIIMLITSLSVVHAKSNNPFQEEHKSHPLKVVVSLDYTKKQFRDGIGKISVAYEDSDGFKKINYYNFDKMMKRESPDPVKVKAKFPRNTITAYEDFLICVTVIKNQDDKCVNESRSPSTDKERIHVSIP